MDKKGGETEGREHHMKVFQPNQKRESQHSRKSEDLANQEEMGVTACRYTAVRVCLPMSIFGKVPLKKRLKLLSDLAFPKKNLRLHVS